MKRTQLGPGRVSRERGSTFKPPRHRKPPTASEREMRAAWARGGKRCALCGAPGPSAHHVITKQRLKQKAAELGVPEHRLLWDRRNRLWLCPTGHAEHHARVRPVSWQELVEHCPKVFQFARELGLVAWLERTYPQAHDERQEP